MRKPYANATIKKCSAHDNAETQWFCYAIETGSMVPVYENLRLPSVLHSIEANKHDFRGYYGLGHAYEIIRMPEYALYYYKQAHKLK